MFWSLSRYPRCGHPRTDDEALAAPARWGEYPTVNEKNRTHLLRSSALSALPNERSFESRRAALRRQRNESSSIPMMRVWGRVNASPLAPSSSPSGTTTPLRSGRGRRPRPAGGQFPGARRFWAVSPRILQAFLGDRELHDLPTSIRTLRHPAGQPLSQYRSTVDAGVLSTVRDRRVRSAVERTYLLHSSAATATATATASLDELSDMTPDQHRHMFLASVAGLIGDFDGYLDRDSIDPIRDGVSCRPQGRPRDIGAHRFIDPTRISSAIQNTSDPGAAGGTHCMPRHRIVVNLPTTECALCGNR